MQYSIVLQWSEQDKAYVALIPELPGLSALGSTPEKAVKELSTAKKAFIEVLKKTGTQLPEPDKMKEHSGQIRVRLPKKLHESLSHEAKKDGISLNTYIVHLLSERNALEKIRKEITISRDMKIGIIETKVASSDIRSLFIYEKEETTDAMVH